MRQIEQLCDTLKSQGRLNANTDSRNLAQLLSFAARGFFRARLMGGRISNEEIRNTFRGFVRTIYEGVKP